MSCAARPIAFVRCSKKEKNGMEKDCERRGKESARGGGIESESNPRTIQEGQRRAPGTHVKLDNGDNGSRPLARNFSRAFVDTDLNINLRPSLGQRQVRKKDRLEGIRCSLLIKSHHLSLDL